MDWDEVKALFIEQLESDMNRRAFDMGIRGHDPMKDKVYHDYYVDRQRAWREWQRRQKIYR